MVALYFSTSVVVMSPLIDIGHLSTLDPCEPHATRNPAWARTALDTPGAPRWERDRKLARRRVGPRRTSPHFSAESASGCGRIYRGVQPLRVEPTRRILDPAVVQVKTGCWHVVTRRIARRRTGGC